MKHIKRFGSVEARQVYVENTPTIAYPYVYYIADTGAIEYSGEEINSPLYIECLSTSCLISLSKKYNVQVSYDGEKWMDASFTYTLFEGERLYIRATGLSASTSAGIMRIGIPEGKGNVGGNVMSLIYGENYRGKTKLTQNYVFIGLFDSDGVYSGLVSARNLVLPATTLSLKCYYGMFRGCANLIHAPKLPAAILKNNCYENMYSGCTNLSYVKCLAQTNIVTYTSNWLEGVAPTGTFVQHPSADWGERGASSIPEGWTIETATE